MSEHLPPDHAGEPSRVELSVVIPTRDRRDRLLASLRALDAQLPADGTVEVIVVDDGSRDGTTDALAALRAPYPLRWLVQPHAGPGAARNRGVAAATGRWCLFLDDDISADPNLVAMHLDRQRRSGGVVAIGPLDLRSPPGADWLVRRFTDSWRAHYRDLTTGARAARITDCYAGNLSVPREALLAAGGWAEDLQRGEDVELGWRLERAGLAIEFVAGAMGTQEYDRDARGVLADARAEGAASLRLHRRHPGIIAELPLGRFGEGGPRGSLARRIMVTLRPPRAVLLALGRILGDRPVGQAWFRLVHGSAYWSGIRSAIDDRDLWRQLTTGVVILMYHAVGRAGEPASRYVIPEHRLARQLAWLRRLGFHILSLQELADILTSDRLPPGRAVVVTFDDGYVDNAHLAGPICRRLGIPAALFVVAERVGQRNDWDQAPPLVGRGLAPWASLADLAEAGWIIGVHGATHRRLVELDASIVEREVVLARSIVERNLSRPARLFAYPYGVADGASRRAVEAAGYDLACGVRDGANWAATERFDLHRTEIRGTDSLARFLLAVLTGYARWPNRRRS